MAGTASVHQRHVGKVERQGVSLTLALPVEIEVEGAAVRDARPRGSLIEVLRAEGNVHALSGVGQGVDQFAVAGHGAAYRMQWAVARAWSGSSCNSAGYTGESWGES